ncbi:MAG: pantoate--beta-alanine ligase [bacterium]
MKIINDINEMHEYIAKLNKRGHTIGFVPTMGALHEGHMSLVDKAASENKKVIMSIFVNPTQFGPNEDFDKYPRPLKKDLKMLKLSGKLCCVFTPEKDKMYTQDAATFVTVENEMTDILCGGSRPGHFKGVTTIVAKLLNIVKPDRLYLGQKDAQQAIIVKKMVNDLHYKTQVVICPIFREKDGLAMSSRNTYLTPEQRDSAPVLYKSLQMAESMIELGERTSETIKKEMKRKIKEAGVEIEYIEIVDSESLAPLDKIVGSVLIAAAIIVGETRLIDNTIIKI